MAEKLLNIENIKTSFHIGKKETVLVLDGVSIRVERGEIIGLVGESGSGKSMTMLSALQLLPGTGRVESGIVELDGDGKNIIDYPPNSPEMRSARGGRMGMIFQEPMTSLNPVIPVGEQIKENIVLHCGLKPRDAKKKAIEMMELVKIADAEMRYDEYPMQFSGGMRQRIMIAMVLAAQPDILIADEATTALDVTTQAQILEIIRELSEKTGVSVILVTHNLGIVARYARRIYVMYSGSIVEQGIAEDVFGSPTHPYTIGLLRAIPRLDDPKDRVLVPIDGYQPRPQDRPAYCPFFDRCAYHDERCESMEKPALRDIGREHAYACHMSQSELKEKRAAAEGHIQSKRPKKEISGEVCLEVNSLSKQFTVSRGMLQKKIAVFNAIEDISFVLHRGETLGIVGESGCGKTTLARTLLRMYEPNTGEIKLFGTDIAHMKRRELTPFRKKITMVFQDPYSSLDPRMTAGAIVKEPLKAHTNYSRTELDARTEELFKMVGLDKNLTDRFPHEFSGGQRQRIGVARALASDPDILLCDEPISALDVSIQAQVINLLEELQAKLGLSYVFIAHDLSVVKHISDRILVMYLGRVMEEAPCEELYDNPLHPYTKALLSAVPIADPVIEKKREYIDLTGDIPSVLNRPKGCPFSNRCKYAGERCRESIPPLRTYGNNHKAACFLMEDIK